MSDSNRVRISYIEEVTRGTTPSGNLQAVNVTGHSISTTPSTVDSQTIRQDGNNYDTIRTDMVPGGGIPTELIFENADPWIESVFRSSFQTQISLSGITFSIDASGSPITLDDSGSGLGDLKPNDVIIVSGFTDSNNNGVFLIGGNTAAGSVDIIAVDPDKTPTTEAAGDSVTITTTRLQNGVTPKFFSIQEDNDLTSIFRAWKGSEFDTLTLTFTAGQVITAAFNMQAQSEPDISATIGTGYTAATTNEVINMEDGYVGTLIGLNSAAAASAPSCVTSATYTITNNVRRTKGANCTKFGNGKFMVTASVTAFFSEKTVYDAFLANQTFSITSAAIDPSNQGYALTVPSMRFTGNNPSVSGPDSDIIATFTGTAKVSTVGSDTYSAILSKLG
jgi:hypothetical protein